MESEAKAVAYSIENYKSRTSSTYYYYNGIGLSLYSGTGKKSTKIYGK
jgi:hypothetical protein